MSKKFDVLVFIGRFQPFHIGHEEVIKTALTLADRVIVVMGSSYQPRSPKNPWTEIERAQMIKECFPQPEVIVTSVSDSLYNDQRWADDVQRVVTNASLIASWKDKKVTGIIGHHKDESSMYLDMFPQWEQVEHRMNEMLSATDLRVLLFEDKNPKFLKSLIPQNVYDFLVKFKESEDYQRLKREYGILKNYKESWKVAPYPVTLVTVDAVVVQSGHVLLIRRGAAPGEDLWALPGGFVGQKERLEDAAIRELREETKLKVPAPVLKGSIVNSKVFDHPQRSQRGRTITHAFYIELPPGTLPKVKGNDDAKDAKWFETSKINKNELYEDHGDIIRYFVGV